MIPVGEEAQEVMEEAQ
jgi:hypothetical protein